MADRIRPPAPLLGRSKSVSCPMVDVARIESGQWSPGDSLTCRWKRYGRSARVLKAYRRHWFARHWKPFEAETRQLAEALAPIRSQSRV